MLTKFITANKMSFLVSGTVFIVILGITIERDPLQIAFILLGTLVGALILQFDYLMYAYFMEPEKDFSKDVKGYIAHKDYSGALEYINYHRNDIKDKTLNSALFQIVLGLAMLFVVSSNAGIFLKSLVVATFVNSIYIMTEEFVEGRGDEWFWSFRTKPTKNKFYTYTGILLLLLVYTLSIFR